MIPAHVVSAFRRTVAMCAARRRDADLNDEIEGHLDLIAQAHVSRGMPIAAARAAARREFGGVDQMKERDRDQRSAISIHQLTRSPTHQRVCFCLC